MTLVAYLGGAGTDDCDSITLDRAGDLFCADELPTLTPGTVSAILLKVRLFRNAFNEREWLLHGLWREEGFDHVFDADLEAE